MAGVLLGVGGAFAQTGGGSVARTHIHHDSIAGIFGPQAGIANATTSANLKLMLKNTTRSYSNGTMAFVSWKKVEGKGAAATITGTSKFAESTVYACSVTVTMGVGDSLVGVGGKAPELMAGFGFGPPGADGKGVFPNADSVKVTLTNGNAAANTGLKYGVMAFFERTRSFVNLGKEPIAWGKDSVKAPVVGMKPVFDPVVSFGVASNAVEGLFSGTGDGATDSVVWGRTDAESNHRNWTKSTVGTAFEPNRAYTAKVLLKTNRWHSESADGFAFNPDKVDSVSLKDLKPVDALNLKPLPLIGDSILPLLIRYPATNGKPSVTVTSNVDVKQIQTGRKINWRIDYKVTPYGHKFDRESLDESSFGVFDDGLTGYALAGLRDSAVLVAGDSVFSVWYKGDFPDELSGTPSENDITFKVPSTVPANVIKTARNIVSNSPAPYDVVDKSGLPKTAVSLGGKAAIAKGNITIAAPTDATYLHSGVRKVTVNVSNLTAITADGGAPRIHVMYFTDEAMTNMVSPANEIDAEADQPSVNEGVSDAGTYYVKVRVVNQFYEGERDGTFRLLEKQLTSAGITMDITGSPQTYTGESLEDFFVLTVKDGTKILVEGEDYEGANDASSPPCPFMNSTDAGTQIVRILGLGNYAGTLSRSIVINRKLIYIDTASMAFINRVYDGKTDLDTAELGDFVKFKTETYASDNLELKNGVDYTVTGTFVTTSGGNTADSANGTRVKFKVTLLDNGETSKNYRLGSDALKGGSADGFKAAARARAVPSAEHFTAPDPATLAHGYTGTPRGVGVVAVKSGYTGMGAFRVLYNGDTALPKEVGTYLLTISVDSLGANFRAGTVTLGNYNISPAALPVLESPITTALTMREGGARTITVPATAAATGDVISFEWFKDGAKVAGNSTASILPTGLREGVTQSYKVVVTNTKTVAAGVREVGKDSVTYTITVIKPAVSLVSVGAVVTVTGTYTYLGGAPVTIPASDLEVTIPAGATTDEVTLARETDYTVSYQRNIEAGTATVVVTGTGTTGDGEYAGIVSKTFAIGKAMPTASDLTFKNSVVYDGKAKPITVTPVSGKGLGDVTPKFDGVAGERTNAGVYLVTVDITEGSNFLAVQGLNIGLYTIQQKTPAKAELAYDTTRFVASGILLDSAKATGIGPVTLEGYTGSLTVLYDGDEEVPEVAEGSWEVSVEIEGDNNFSDAVIALGTYKIVNKIGVKGSDRVVPKPVVTEEAAVAPIAKVAASFTAGPSPVSKASGKVTFFSAKQVKQGGLYVFDAAGNVVAKIAAKAGTGAIGSWNLKDKKGAAVAEGSYVVKGVLTGKDGTREKVSFVFAVVR
jgi:hypothetical protein